jgi:hypothetical protein
MPMLAPEQAGSAGSRLPGPAASLPWPLQPKLQIGAAADPLEQEADHVAEQVMRMPDPGSVTTASDAGMLRRKCACGGTPGPTGECAACRAKRLGLQRQSARALTPAVAPPIVHEVLHSPGQPLDGATRAFMEPRFGHDFGRVRVHTDARAAEAARAVRALAYTVGRDVTFGAGRYAPETGEGQRLLAHELTHVVQQGAATGRTHLVQALSSAHAGGGGDHALEHEAAMQAEAPIASHIPTRGHQVRGRSTRPVLQRQGSGPTSSSPTVYMCAKDLGTSPIGRHAFFRIGSIESGNPTYELEPQDNRALPSQAGSNYGTGCWQGVPMRNVPEDRDSFRMGDCEATPISLSCLESEFAAYPVGRYCTFGPNSNTFVGHIARRCGLNNPDPSGWTPGIDDNPPSSGTYAPSPDTTLLGCVEETGCLVLAETELAGAMPAPSDDQTTAPVTEEAPT